jgi:NADH-quinone oxidoreductase subunit M
MLRISYPMFPDGMAHFQYALAFIGFVNIVYGALCAMAQKDFKKLIAYSSISHMGYVVLGMAALNTQGVTGAIFQMFNHGTITAMLFLIVGVIYDRAHTRGVEEFGGLANEMPKYTGIVVVAFFAAIGLPGLSGFISEAFVFLGAFKTNVIQVGATETAFRVVTILSTLGIVLGAGYMLWTLQRMFFGKLPERWAGHLPDISRRELVSLVPLAVIIIFLGVYPSPVLDLMTSSVNHLVDFVQKGSGTMMGVLGR